MMLHVVFVLATGFFETSNGQSFCTDHVNMNASCFSEPTDCTEVNDCEMTMVVENLDQDTLTFTMTGKSDGWVAVGLSGDRTMGNDDVLMCLFNGDNVILLDRWNSGRTNRASYSVTSPLKLTEESLVLISSSINNEIISCQFNRSREVNGSAETFSLRNAARYLLFGRGRASGGEPRMHVRNPWVSDEEIDFATGVKIEITESLMNSRDSVPITPPNGQNTAVQPTTAAAVNTAIYVSRFLFLLSFALTVLRLW